MNPRGRLRRRRRIATETMQSHRRSQKWSSSVPDLTQEASFRVIFAELRARRHRGGPKGLCYFYVHTQTTADRIWARSEAFEILFSTPKTALLPAVAHKTVSKSNVSILLTTSLKSSSGDSLVCTRLKVRLRRNQEDSM